MEHFGVTFGLKTGFGEALVGLSENPRLLLGPKSENVEKVLVFNAFF